MEMSELKAGRELDQMIAEKILGLTVRPIQVIGFGGIRADIGTVSEPYTMSDGREGVEAKAIPAYSTDMNSAMQVVEKMRQSQKWCCITIHSDHDYVWRVSFTRSSTEDSDTHEPAVSITGESLPECICLAALEAVESLEVKNETATD